MHPSRLPSAGSASSSPCLPRFLHDRHLASATGFVAETIVRSERSKLPSVRNFIEKKELPSVFARRRALSAPEVSRVAPSDHVARNSCFVVRWHLAT